MSTLNFDWQKQAQEKIAASGPVDNMALEKAFMDQAYGYVANKSSQLFRDPYRLGFEVVFKNEQMTRMVGLFAFRLGKRLLYAPVFFLNGAIKGYDLLYKQWVKKFCPNTQEWVAFLVESAESNIGNLIDRSEAGRIRSAIKWDVIAQPPAFKTASVNQEWEMLLDEMSLQTQTKEGALKDFMTKHASEGAFEKLASLIERSSAFADAIARLPEDSWCPTIPVMPKKASAQPVIEYHTEHPGVMTPDEAEFYMTHGCLFRDKRAADETSRVTEVPSIGTGIPGAGKFDMLMPGGEWRSVIAAYSSAYPFGNNTGNSCPVAPGHRGTRRMVVVDTASKHSYQDADPGDCVIDDSKVSDDERPEDIGDEKAKANTGYRVLDLSLGTLSEPFYVTNVKDNDGVQVLDCYRYAVRKDCPDFVLRVNPEVPQSEPQDCVVGPRARFVEVACKLDSFVGQLPASQKNILWQDADARPGTMRDMDRMLQGNSELQRLTVSEDPVYKDFKLASAGRFVELQKPDAIYHLMQMGVAMDTAANMLETSGRSKDWLITKRAYATRLNNQEKFVEGNDGIFGLTTEWPQDFTLGTTTQRVRNAKPLVGDAWDPAEGRGAGRRTSDPIPEDLIMSLKPEQLADIANTNRLPNVFEHGAIGSMVKTYDSIAMIESYIPDMENCLDRLGRGLFLLYFKPSDFEKAYGTDDMQTQENDFLNSFKTLGDLTLQLLKRRRGGGGDTGNETAGTSVQMLD